MEKLVSTIPMPIRTLGQYRGKNMIIRGWVSKVRSQKRFSFVEVRDDVGAASKVQVVVSGETDIPLESYVEVNGLVKELPPGKYSYQPVEIQMESLKIIGKSNADYSGKCPADAGPETKLEQRHLHIRDEQFAIITKLRAKLVHAIRMAFDAMDCTEIFPPCFVGNQCEGGATLFKLKYPPSKGGADDVDAYLTQSSQFYLEMALPALGNTYCIYPSFRAERSHTRRHLTEFLHAECEWKDVITFEDHLRRIRILLDFILANFYYLGGVQDLLMQLGKKERVMDLIKMPVEVMTHAEAIKYCREHNIYKDEETQTHFDPRDDIPEKQEREMIDQIGKIILLCKFPREFKSFYMATDPDDSSLALGCDVEVPGVGEIIGSGVRVWDEAELKERLKEQGLKEEEYREYIDLRKYGFARTSGMGLGVDRMLTWILGVNSIRDVVTFPRYPGRLTP